MSDTRVKICGLKTPAALAEPTLKAKQWPPSWAAFFVVGIRKKARFKKKADVPKSHIYDPDPKVSKATRGYIPKCQDRQTQS